MKTNPELAAAFGRVLERHRIERGIPQDKLALASGLDRSFVWRVAQGQTNPSLESIFKLAGALGHRPEDLVHEARLELETTTGTPPKTTS